MKEISIIFFLSLSISLYSIEFRYKFNESYRIESTVYQNVLLNRKIELSSVILNRYSVNIIKDCGDYAELNVSHHVFQESKGFSSGFYTFHESEKGIIEQKYDGSMKTITNKYFPAVQNIPYFPDRDITMGESWTSMAIEYFDLNNGFSIDDIIKASFRVFYTYTANRIIDGIEVAVISMNYNIFENIKPYIEWGYFYPVKILGSSKQTLYWDIKKGRPYSVDDNFVLDFFTSTGDQYTFKGNTESRSWPKNNLKSDNMLALINTLEQVPQTTVTDNDEYLTITFSSLLFSPESSLILNEVEIYLDEIGNTFKTMGDVNIRIIGHTALFGKTDLKYLKDLSVKRARSVAEYLLENGFIDKKSIEIIGMGGSKPVDSNVTKEGRTLNRRVEIDILKN